MDNCCHTNENTAKKKPDYLLIISAALIVPLYILNFLSFEYNEYIMTMSMSVKDLMNQMWWGLLAGIFFVGLLDKTPRELVMSILGRKRGFASIFKATLAGVLLDLCSHGILLVGMKFYERGASLGQVMAFLIASPWNSFSLTLILWALIGFKWMMTFLLLSFVIALISGVIFDMLVDKKILPDNPNKLDESEDTNFWKEFNSFWQSIDFNLKFFKDSALSGLSGSKMILRWIFLGVILASLIRTFVTAAEFQSLFAPTLLGLGLTVFAATVIEVCSEGSTPIAADIFTRAHAPGNSFAFLMSGVSTDYTEIMGLRETTKSWKISLFLPLVTLPQIIFVSWIINLLG